jgi:hypothetical protein
MTGHIPFFFFFWGPALVALGLVLMRGRTRRYGVIPALGSDIDGYGTRDVREILERYGPQVRAGWRAHILPADTAFAAFYGLVGVGVTLGLVERGHAGWLALLCGGGWALAAIADITENLAFSRMVERFPIVEDWNVMRASACTALKFWLFVAGTLGVLVAFYLARPTADPLLRALFSAQ